MAKIKNYWKSSQQPQRAEKSGKKHGAREPRREGRFASRPEKMHPHHCISDTRLLKFFRFTNRLNDLLW